MTKKEKEIRIIPAFHKVHKDPNKDYGVGCVKVRMILKGEEGAVHFVFGTGMYLPKTYRYWEERGLHKDTNKPDYMGYDVGYHSPEDLYEHSQKRDCDILENGKCYGDGSALYADEVMKMLVEKGGDEVWEELHRYYDNIFTKPTNNND